MKACLVLLILVLFVAVYGTESSDEEMEKDTKYHMECMKKIGIDEDKMDVDNGAEYFQQYVLCMFQLAGMLADDGTLLKDVIMANLPTDGTRQQVSDAIDACIDTKGATPQETTLLFAECFTKTYII